MATTTNIGVTLVEPSQAQKEVPINQALTTIDAMLVGTVVDKDLAAPPGGASSGSLYIIAASPTGSWAGKQHYLTYYDQDWQFIAPKTTMRVWVMDENLYYQFNGTSWQIANALGVAAGGTGQNTYSNGQLLIGNSTGNTLTKTTLTAGTGISVTNGAGSITLANTAPAVAASMAKAWVRFTVSAGVVTVASSYNVTSVVRNLAGDFTVNFTTAFASANYVASGMAGTASIGTIRQHATAPTTTAFRFEVLNNTGASVVDPSVVMLTFFGN